ncbi:hypothetical protein C8P66_111134 [Humitalea rosea]|uniref:Polymerase nucleotidyl transferase domain-containing protein n=1 Tax=Humitalea rosea TaxID=990373 RepID=A0A2W7IFN2_9PROT|nr:nucleotidyltransferase domain-containing protein [Humitalea rosea]PZW45718.1 hypothetical protein C8P66_111134 [Humitalea rosea]
MDAQTILAILRSHQAELTEAGVIHAGLFGSAARGESGPGSDIDIDILVEFAPGQPADVFAYAGLKAQVAALLPGRVDVIDRDAMRPAVRSRVLRDLQSAF